MNFEEMSLAELIESQQKDMRRGHLAEMQPKTVALNRLMASGDEMGDTLLSNEGMMFKNRWRGNGCQIHGFAYMGGKASPKCRACEKDRRDLKRRLSGKDRRKTAERDEHGVAAAPACEHGDERRLTVVVEKHGKWARYRCMDCDADRKREYYRANREKVLAQKKAKRLENQAKGLTARGTKPVPREIKGARLVGTL